MNRTLSEQKVLKKLNILDFRHLTKDKVIKMASMLDKMDPEVAKKALEQFPQFATTTKEMLDDYKETLDLGLADNKESVHTYYASCNSIINSLKKELENEDLSFDEKKYIINQMREIAQMIGDKDSENKRFIATMSLVAGGVLLGTIAALSSTLGSNTDVNDEDTEDDYK